MYLNNTVRIIVKQLTTEVHCRIRDTTFIFRLEKNSQKSQEISHCLSIALMIQLKVLWD